ncbi:unnamed protein product [Protopolystoma xenopodis]|uniref:Uncharacterized protein n=1 Tax=Protopolystoma xenopodis TaxID=117903 RepID=A0A3S5CKQ8_9PLAT|nr:unnamed protein product [Protopolystoma xenopodis]
MPSMCSFFSYRRSSISACTCAVPLLGGQHAVPDTNADCALHSVASPSLSRVNPTPCLHSYSVLKIPPFSGTYFSLGSRTSFSFALSIAGGIVQALSSLSVVSANPILFYSADFSVPHESSPDNSSFTTFPLSPSSSPSPLLPSFTSSISISHSSSTTTTTLVPSLPTSAPFDAPRSASLPNHNWLSGAMTSWTAFNAVFMGVNLAAASRPGGNALSSLDPEDGSRQPVRGGFYTGSRLFDPLSQLVGVSLDQINFVLVCLATLCLGLVMRRWFAPPRYSAHARATLEILFGVMLVSFCFGQQLRVLLLQSAIAYVFLLIIPNRRTAAVVVTAWSMLYLSAVHLCRLHYDYGGYTLDISGPVMIQTQRLSTLAFNLLDGERLKRHQQTQAQLREDELALQQQRQQHLELHKLQQVTGKLSVDAAGFDGVQGTCSRSNSPLLSSLILASDGGIGRANNSLHLESASRDTLASEENAPLLHTGLPPALSTMVLPFSSGQPGITGLSTSGIGISLGKSSLCPSGLHLAGLTKSSSDPRLDQYRHLLAPSLSNSSPSSADSITAISASVPLTNRIPSLPNDFKKIDCPQTADNGIAPGAGGASVAAVYSSNRSHKSYMPPSHIKHAVDQLPDPIEFAAYMLNFHGVCVGPFVFYVDYRAYLDGYSERKLPPINFHRFALLALRALAFGLVTGYISPLLPFDTPIVQRLEVGRNYYLLLSLSMNHPSHQLLYASKIT